MPRIKHSPNTVAKVLRAWGMTNLGHQIANLFRLSKSFPMAREPRTHRSASPALAAVARECLLDSLGTVLSGQVPVNLNRSLLGIKLHL